MAWAPRFRVAVAGCAAAAASFASPWQLAVAEPSHRRPFRVVVIGAGIGGASTAYFLRQEVNKRLAEVGGGTSQGLEIRVIDRRPQVGGRIRPIELGESCLEAGASIAVADNKYLAQFAEEAGLDTGSPVTGRLAIWDGDAGFPFEQGTWGVYNTFAILWRYGLSLMRVSSHVASAVKSFSKVYDLQEAGEAFRTPQQLWEALGLYEETQQTLQQYFAQHSVCDATSAISRELIDGVIRVNYNQDSSSINALAGLVGLAPLTGGAVWQVNGGKNWHIVKHLLERADAEVSTNTTVTGVWRTADGARWVVGVKSGSNDGEERVVCDRVVLACPAHLARVPIFDGPRFDSSHRVCNHPQALDRYKQTVATFVRGKLNREFFRLPAGVQVPDFVLTTATADAGFTSVGLQVAPDRKLGKPGVYKVFSHHVLKPALLDKLFVERVMTRSVAFMAYPHFTPPEAFAASFNPVPGSVYYVPALERGACAMEVLAVGGRNVALLLSKDLQERDLALCRRPDPDCGGGD